ETYVDILRHLSSIGATRVRLDEPALALDLDEAFAERYARAYARCASEIPDLAIEVAVYFGELRGNLPILLSLPVAGIHVDAVRARAELPALVDGLAASDKELSLGLIDGRNVWKTDLKSALSLAKDARERLGS